MFIKQKSDAEFLIFKSKDNKQNLNKNLSQKRPTTTSGQVKPLNTVRFFQSVALETQWLFSLFGFMSGH